MNVNILAQNRHTFDHAHFHPTLNDKGTKPPTTPTIIFIFRPDILNLKREELGSL
jgi:hypothetical protein